MGLGVPNGRSCMVYREMSVFHNEKLVFFFRVCDSTICNSGDRSASRVFT